MKRTAPFAPATGLMPVAEAVPHFLAIRNASRSCAVNSGFFPAKYLSVKSSPGAATAGAVSTALRITPRSKNARPGEVADEHTHGVVPQLLVSCLAGGLGRVDRDEGAHRDRRALHGALAVAARFHRSEERRVG